jgi:hypothetical protein
LRARRAALSSEEEEELELDAIGALCFGAALVVGLLAQGRTAREARHAAFGVMLCLGHRTTQRFRPIGAGCQKA